MINLYKYISLKNTNNFFEERGVSMKKKTIFLWALICLVVSLVTIQYINYKRNIEVTSGMPSEKWSKDKSVSKGFIKSNPSRVY